MPERGAWKICGERARVPMGPYEVHGRLTGAGQSVGRRLTLRYALLAAESLAPLRERGVLKNTGLVGCGEASQLGGR